MGPTGRVFFVSTAVVVVLLQCCLLGEGLDIYAKVSKKRAEEIADNAFCLGQAAYSVTAAITPDRDVCLQVAVSPDKSAPELIKSQVLEYLVDDYKTLTELIMAGQQYCYYVYLNRTYECNPNANCTGICERLLNQSRAVAAQARQIILGLGCGCPSTSPECNRWSFMPPFEVNSTVYSKITDMHSLASGIMSAACNLADSVTGYRIARLKGVQNKGGSPVDKICVRSSDSMECPECEAHFNDQCKL